MSSRGLSRGLSLVEGFNAMYDTVGRVQRDRELRQAATAAPQMDEGFTPEQGAQLEAAASSGQYDIEYDPAIKGYRVISRANPTSVGVIRQGPRQTLLGQVQSTPLDQAGLQRARNLEMAGVYERHGDIVSGARLRERQEAVDDRAYQRERARADAAHQDWVRRRAVEQDEAERTYREGAAALIDNTFFGQRSKAFQEQMSRYEAEKKSYDERVAKGDASAIPPTPPQQPTMTSAEKLLDAASVVSFKARHGKASPEEILKVSEQMTALGSEGYLNMLRMAQGGAPLTAVVAAFNSSGKAQLDPNAIIKDERVKRPGGVESRLITYRLPDGRTQTIDTQAELAGLGKADELLKQAQQEHQQRIQERQVAVSEGNLRLGQAAEGRHQAEFRAGAPRRDAQAAEARLRVELANTTNPERQKELEAKIRALSTGARGGGGGATTPMAEREARALVDRGDAPDMATAREALSGRAEKVFDRHFDKAIKEGLGDAEAMAAARRRMRAAGYEERAGYWVKVAPKTFASEAEVQAAIKAGQIKRGDRVIVNGRPATLD